MAPGYNLTGFDPLKSVTWTATTESSGMKKLVEERETIFANQRTYKNDRMFTSLPLLYLLADLNRGAVEMNRQTRSQTAVESNHTTEAGKAILLTQYSRYRDFCQAVKVPTHPMSTSMIALFAFAKCSFKNLDIRNTLALLRDARKRTAQVWEYTNALGSLEDSASVALKEFQKERKGVRVRPSKKNKSREFALSQGSYRTVDSSADNTAYSSHRKTAISNNGSTSTSIYQSRSHKPAKVAQEAVSTSDLSGSDDSESDLDFGDSENEGQRHPIKSRPSSRPVSAVASPDQRSRTSQLVGLLMITARLYVSLSLTPATVQPTAGIPRAGQRFGSIEDLLVAAYKAIVPVYGIGCYIYAGMSKINCSRNHSQARQLQGRCSWQIVGEVDEETGEIVVSGEKSTFEHNHGPEPRIIEDPNWRPEVKVLAIRRAMGLDNPQEASSMNKVSRFSVCSLCSLDKLMDCLNQRELEEIVSPISESPARSHSESTFKKPRLPPPLVNRPVASTSNIGRTIPPTSSMNGASQSRSHQKPHSASPSLRHTPNQSIPLAQPHSPHQITQPRASNTRIPQIRAPDHTESSLIRPLSSSSTDSFLPQLSSFLRSLHPSLGALAIPLHSSGLDSLELLHLFNAFESTTLDSYFRLLKERDVDQTISNVHLRLLKKKLEEARLGRYSD